MSNRGKERNPIEVRNVVYKYTPALLTIAIALIGFKSCFKPLIDEAIVNNNAYATATAIAQATYDALPLELRPTKAITPTPKPTSTPEPSVTPILEKVSDRVVFNQDYGDECAELSGL